jgi:hypothetical protein
MVEPPAPTRVAIEFLTLWMEPGGEARLHAVQHLTRIIIHGPDNIGSIVAGLLLGGLYLASGRNLIVPIIAHGITDTVDFLLIYSGQHLACFPVCVCHDPLSRFANPDDALGAAASR